MLRICHENFIHSNKKSGISEHFIDFESAPLAHAGLIEGKQAQVSRPF